MFTILVMDDDANLRRLFSKTLSKTHHVYTASTLNQARELLQQHHFDVFVCDMRMGEDIGLDLLVEYYPTLLQQGTTVIVLSADNHYFNECRVMGIELIIAKPVMPHSLVHIVENLLVAS